MNGNRIRIVNTSRFPTAIVKALVQFARGKRECGDVAMNVKNTRAAYRGRAYNHIPTLSKRVGRYLVVVCVGEPRHFPVASHRYPGLTTAPEVSLADWQEAMVFVAAHELTHTRQYKRREPLSEIEAEHSALQTLIRFRAVRASLNVETAPAPVPVASPVDRVDAMPSAPAPIVWTEIDAGPAFLATVAPPLRAAASPAPKPRPSIVDARRAKAAADLARWQRKLKLATTKVRKLKARVRYYERAKPSASPVAPSDDSNTTSSASPVAPSDGHE